MLRGLGAAVTGSRPPALNLAATRCAICRVVSHGNSEGVQVTDESTYKKPLYICAWLDTALEKEWQKYSATPVMPDMAPGHEEAQAWGYVVAGYFLIEQGLKGVLHMRDVQPP